MTPETPDLDGLAFFRFAQAMRDLTTDEVIQSLWHQRRWTSHPYIPFVLSGGLNWRDPKDPGVATSDRSLLLRPVRQESDYPERFSSSTSHGPAMWVEIHAPASTTTAAEALPVLTAAVERAHILTDLLSVLYGMPLSWFPAIYLGSHPIPEGEHHSRDLHAISRSSEAMTSAVVDAEDLRGAVLPRYEALRDMRDTPFRLVLLTAFSWHAQGNSLGAGLNRFLNYWSALELVATYLYDHLPRAVTGAPTRSVKKSRAMALLKGPHRDDTCYQTIDQLTELKRPTIRTKARILGLFSKDAQALEALLFDSPGPEKPSLYSLRNDIAHGNVGQHHRAFLPLVAGRLEEMRQLSRTLLLRFLFVADRVQTELDRSDTSH